MLWSFHHYFYSMLFKRDLAASCVWFMATWGSTSALTALQSNMSLRGHFREALLPPSVPFVLHSLSGVMKRGQLPRRISLPMAQITECVSVCVCVWVGMCPRVQLDSDKTVHELTAWLSRSRCQGSSSTRLVCVADGQTAAVQPGN